MIFEGGTFFPSGGTAALMLPGGTPTKRMSSLLLEGGTVFPSGEYQL